MNAIDVVVTGVGTVATVDVGHADVDSINVTGVSTISQVDIGKITVGDLTVSGFATVTEGLEVVGGGATINGTTNLVGSVAISTNLTVNGNTQLGDDFALDTVTFVSQVSSQIVPKADSAFGLGLTTLRWATIFVDSATITNNASVGGDLSVDGDVDLGDTSADFVRINGRVSTSVIPATDSATDLGENALRWRNVYADQLIITDNATLGADLSVGGEVSVGGSVTSASVITGDLNVSGVATFSQIAIGTGGGGISSEGVTINNVTVTDQSTLNNLSVLGIATFAGDVEIGGNLTLTGDLQYDEVNGRNANITGVGTVGTLGVTSSLTVGEESTFNGVVSAAKTTGIGLTVTSDTYLGGNLEVAGITTVNGDLDVDGHTELDNLNVSGLSTFVGVSSFKGDVYIDGNLIIDGDNSQDLVSGTNLLVTGIATIGTLGVTTDVTVGNTVTAERFVGMGSGLTHLPPASFLSTEAPATRPDGSPIQVGDIWFDSNDLRQFTRYSSGIATEADIWIDSNPTSIIPDLKVNAGTGASSFVNLLDGSLDILGTANQIETSVVSVGGTGSQVTVGLTSDVQITRNLGVGGTITADTLIVANFEVDAEGLVFDQARANNVLVTGVSSVTTQYVNTGFATNFTVTDTFTLANPVNSIGIGSDLGGVGSAHTALASQKAIKDYVDNRINIVDQDLEFEGDTGSGVIGIATEALAINGTAEQIQTVGAGNSVTIGLPNATRVQQRLTVGGDLFTQVADFSATNGTTFSNKIVTFNAPATFGANDINTLRNIQSTGIATFNQVSFTGIITTTGNAFVGGDLSVAGDVTANDYNSTSDESKKNNVAEIPDALSKVLDLRGVTFNWKDGSGSSAGVIAQEVEKILPEIVKGNPGDMTVQYNGIIALLVEAVKELSAEVEHLKATKSDKRRKKA
jgi:hypothetical protein